MKPGYERKPTIPGYYLRNGLWWTAVTDWHMYYTRAGELKVGYRTRSNADHDHATRYDTLDTALEAKRGVEHHAYVTRHDVVEVRADGSMVNWTSDTPPSPDIPTDLGAKVLGELMESYGE